MLNNLHSAFTQVESLAYATELNVASDLRVFLSVMRRQVGTRALLKSVTTDRAAQAVLDRLIRLCEAEVEEGFRHPRDVALAVYLFALHVRHPHRVADAVASVERAGGLWWAALMADAIMTQPMKTTLQIPVDGARSVEDIWDLVRALRESGAEYAAYLPYTERVVTTTDRPDAARALAGLAGYTTEEVDPF